MPKKYLSTVLLAIAALAVFTAVYRVQNLQKTKRVSANETADETPRPRLISLQPSITETLCMLGLEKNLIGRSHYCDYPPSVTNLPAVGSYGNANIEAIARMKPDFVLMSGLDSQSGIHEALEKLRINHLGIQSTSLNDITQSVWELGERFGASEMAEAWLAHINGLLESARAAAPERAPKVLFCAGRDPGSLDRIYISGRGNFYEQIAIKCGGVNAYENELSAPMVSVEGVMAMNPDIIVDVLAGAGIEDMKKAYSDWSRLTSVNAVKTGNVCVLNESWAARPGPRIDLLIEKVADCVKKWGESGD